MIPEEGPSTAMLTILSVPWQHKQQFVFCLRSLNSWFSFNNLWKVQSKVPLLFQICLEVQQHCGVP